MSHGHAGGHGGHGGHGGFGHHGHQGHHGHHAHHHLQHGDASQTAAYNSGFKGIKLSALFSGIRFSVNFFVAMFFLAYTFWLFVVYFIRHNEPFANQVLGSPVAGRTSQQDKRLVAGMANALPIHAEFYSPEKPEAGKSKQNPGDPILSTHDLHYARFVGHEGTGANRSAGLASGELATAAPNRLFSAGGGRRAGTVQGFPSAVRPGFQQRVTNNNQAFSASSVVNPYNPYQVRQTQAQLQSQIQAPMSYAAPYQFNGQAPYYLSGSQFQPRMSASIYPRFAASNPMSAPYGSTGVYGGGFQTPSPASAFNQVSINPAASLQSSALHEPAGGQYNIPVRTQDGLKCRTVINR